MKILLAHPDASFRAEFLRLVRARGGEVRLAASAEECRSALASFRPDVAVASRDLPAEGPRDLASLLTDGPLASIATVLLVGNEAGVVSVVGDAVAVTLREPVRPDRLISICGSVRRIGRERVPMLARQLNSAVARSPNVESDSSAFGH